ncbi:MAG: bifunctional oligoribonuclease/PAP phosphatase NrnA [Clostridia bacterium]|nr:bifunctional oligoribonuclease/PAP phosphatase NrnA [Clostridia bacterium]
MISLHDLVSKLKKERSVALLCHARPDGDCLGGACALKLAFQKQGVKAVVCSMDTVPERFKFLPEMKKVVSALDVKEEFSAMIAIDCADLTRLTENERFIRHKNTYNIDHHVSNQGYATVNYIVDCAANCQNVIDIVKQMGVEFDNEMADLLMLGMVTDTGFFRHKNTTSETLAVASELKKCGANLNLIGYKTFTEQSKERAKLFGMVMSKIRYFLGDRFAVATINLSDLESSGAKADETEGFIDFVMGVDTVEVGACLMEISESKYKISFRSKQADVNAVASCFGGGGHVLASGCQIAGEYEEVVDKITFAVSRELKD